eukprot:g83453.t1
MSTDSRKSNKKSKKKAESSKPSVEPPDDDSVESGGHAHSHGGQPGTGQHEEESGTMPSSTDSSKPNKKSKKKAGSSKASSEPSDDAVVESGGKAKKKSKNKAEKSKASSEPADDVAVDGHSHGGQTCTGHHEEESPDNPENTSSGDESKGAGHGHSHGGQPCSGHHEEPAEDESKAGHGHSHGGQPCTGHHDEPEGRHEVTPDEIEHQLAFEASQQNVPYMKLPVHLLLRAAPGSPIRQLGEARKSFVQAFRTDWKKEPMVACKLFCIAIITHYKSEHASTGRYRSIMQLLHNIHLLYFAPDHKEEVPVSEQKYFHILNAHAAAVWLQDLRRCDQAVTAALEMKNIDKEEMCYLNVIRGQCFFQRARRLAEESGGQNPEIKVLLRRAIKEFNRAIAACPNRTLPYVRLASAHAFEAAADDVQRCYENYFKVKVDEVQSASPSRHEYANDQDENMYANGQDENMCANDQDENMYAMDEDENMCAMDEDENMCANDQDENMVYDKIVNILVLSYKFAQDEDENMIYGIDKIVNILVLCYYANDEDENMAEVCFLYCGHKAALLETRRKMSFPKLPAKFQQLWAKQIQQYYVKGRTLLEAGFWGPLEGEAADVARRVTTNMQIVINGGFELEEPRLENPKSVPAGSSGEGQDGAKSKKKKKKKKKKKAAEDAQGKAVGATGKENEEEEEEA